MSSLQRYGSYAMAGKQADEATRLVVGRGRREGRDGQEEKGGWKEEEGVTGSCKTAS